MHGERPLSTNLNDSQSPLCSTSSGGAPRPPIRLARMKPRSIPLFLMMLSGAQSWSLRPAAVLPSNDYSGNTVTVTDPAGKQRKNVTDALGRLVEVDEPGIVADHTPDNNRATMQTDGNF